MDIVFGMLTSIYTRAKPTYAPLSLFFSFIAANLALEGGYAPGNDRINIYMS